MHTDRQHLYKSRHGIWYYRWVLPSRLRSKHPALPRELKRSTRTADIRHARAIARCLHHKFVVQYAMDLGMDPPWPELTGIREFKVKCDPVTGLVTEVEAEAHEAETAVSLAQRIQAANLRQAEMIAFINRRERELRLEAPLALAPSEHAARLTSGGKGLHVVVPLTPKLDYEMVKGFSQAAVQHMARTIPERFVAKSGGTNRVGKIFIDYLRNGHGQTTAAAFSARARPGLGVSMPVAWDELMNLKGGVQWSIATAREYLSFQARAPWGSYWKKRQTLTGAMKTLGVEPKRRRVA